ncbi:hypothetical protein F5H01DRAFT_160461 [Linnemannia elongata]|nr:hypothetical protein F5H01DRAFT_160461 [Linnemannia elongata]
MNDGYAITVHSRPSFFSLNPPSSVCLVALAVGRVEAMHFFPACKLCDRLLRCVVLFVVALVALVLPRKVLLLHVASSTYIILHHHYHHRQGE